MGSTSWKRVGCPMSSKPATAPNLRDQKAPEFWLTTENEQSRLSRLRLEYGLLGRQMLPKWLPEAFWGSGFFQNEVVERMTVTC